MVPSVVDLVGRDTGNTIPTLEATLEDGVEDEEEGVGEEDVVEEDRAFDERPRLFRGPRPVVVSRV